MNTTDPTTTNTDTATLDPDRTDRLRTFLVVEAAADLAHARSTQHGRAGTTFRRMAVGGVAAALLVGALIALDAGSRSKDNRADAAVSIVKEDGWTTLHLDDLDASADDVLAELHAAGISAKAEPEGTTTYEGSGGSIEVVGVSTEAADTEESRANAAPGTIVGILVSYIDPDGSSVEETYGEDGPEFSRAEQRAMERKIGVQTDPEAHTVSIRNTDDHPVTLLLAT